MTRTADGPSLHPPPLLLSSAAQWVYNLQHPTGSAGSRWTCVFLHTLCTPASAQPRNEEEKMGPEPLYPPRKGAQTFHLTHLRIKDKSTKMSWVKRRSQTILSLSESSAPNTNHSVDLSNPHLVSFLANITEAAFHFNLLVSVPPRELPKASRTEAFSS